MSDTILPTVHLNGTSRKMLTEGYDQAAKDFNTFTDSWDSIEFNHRDYYVQGPEAYQQAREQRIEIAKKIRDIRQYLTEHREHLHA